MCYGFSIQRFVAAIFIHKINSYYYSGNKPEMINILADNENDLKNFITY